MELREIAEAAHEANRVLQRSLGEEVNPPWDSAPEELRASVLDGVKNIVTGRITTPEESHKSWLDFKEADGWTYGEEKDFLRKTHPCFVAYDQLPPEQKFKDTLFFAIVGALKDLL